MPCLTPQPKVIRTLVRGGWHLRARVPPGELRSFCYKCLAVFVSTGLDPGPHTQLLKYFSATELTCFPLRMHNIITRPNKNSTDHGECYNTDATSVMLVPTLESIPSRCMHESSTSLSRRGIDSTGDRLASEYTWTRVPVPGTGQVQFNIHCTALHTALHRILHPTRPLLHIQYPMALVIGNSLMSMDVQFCNFRPCHSCGVAAVGCWGSCVWVVWGWCSNHFCKTICFRNSMLVSKIGHTIVRWVHNNKSSQLSQFGNLLYIFGTFLEF